MINIQSGFEQWFAVQLGFCTLRPPYHVHGGQVNVTCLDAMLSGIESPIGACLSLPGLVEVCRFDDRALETLVSKDYS